MLVPGRTTGAFVTKEAEMVSASRGTLSKVITAFEKERKTSSFMQNSIRKSRLSERDRRGFVRIVKKEPQITTKLKYLYHHDSTEISLMGRLPLENHCFRVFQLFCPTPLCYIYIYTNTFMYLTIKNIHIYMTRTLSSMVDDT